MSGQGMSGLQVLYAKLVKIAEEEPCKMCDEKAITDIWHSMCAECAIRAEEDTFEAQFEGQNDPDLEES